MIDFALEAERSERKSPHEAIYQACLLRFRPIMMTTMAALLGAVAAGVRHRRRLGTAAAARHHHHRRLDLQPAAHALHDARHLSLLRRLADKLLARTRRKRQSGGADAGDYAPAAEAIA